MIECKGEFFESLDFLVTFLAMKKVTDLSLLLALNLQIVQGWILNHK